MKKYLLLLSILTIVAIPAFAADLTTKDITSEDYIHKHGYSDEMARLIDLQNAQINGESPRFKSRNPDWYTSNKKVNFLRKVFMYLDCAQDDEHFGDHSIYFSPLYKEDSL